MSLRPRSRLSWALVASAALALSVAVLPVTTASAGSPSKSTFTATISPTTVDIGSTPQGGFILTVTNTSSGNTGIGSVQVAVPAEFAVDESQQTIYMQPPVGPATPTDWVYSWPSCSSDSPCTPGSTLVQVNTPNSSGADKVPPGYSLIIPVVATAAAGGCQVPWPVAAKNSAAWSSGQLLTPQGPVPAVSVGSSNPQLVVGTPTDEAGLGVLVANQAFDVPVFVQDHATPVCFAGTVDLTVTDAAGTSTALGTVTFTGTQAELTQGETVKGAQYPGYGNDLKLTATLDPSLPSSSSPTAGTRQMDVSLYGLKYSKPFTPGTNITLSNSACIPSASTPVCGTLLLPNGAYNSQPVVLAQGACTGTLNEATCLDPEGPVLVNMKANIGLVGDTTYPNLYGTTTDKYGYTDPATAILQCDKSLCGGGGTNSYPITFESGGQVYTNIPPCPAKGTLGFGPPFACQDYVQNHRDNAGDLIAYVLFLEDPKMNF